MAAEDPDHRGAGMIADQRKMKKPCRYCGSTIRYESHFGEAWAACAQVAFARRQRVLYKGRTYAWPFCCTACYQLSVDDGFGP